MTQIFPYVHYHPQPSNDPLQILRKEPFNPKLWSEKFEEAKKDPSLNDLLKPLRKIIMEGTIKACNDRSYYLPDGKKILLTKLFEKQRSQTMNYIYLDTQDFDPLSHPEFAKKLPKKSKVYVEDDDCIDIAIKLKKEGRNPLVLNMANARHPGGGYLNGAGAQEETLFRRTNYYQFLDPYNQQSKSDNENYPIKDFGGIYSSNVLVFRKSEKEGYAFMENPIPLSFVAVAAYPNPPLKNPTTMEEIYEVNTRRKIRSIFKIAWNHKHDCLILGAFGCGAFKNPPNHVAKIFKQVLDDYSKFFEAIYFAILEDFNSFQGHNLNGNLVPFREVFKKKNKMKEKVENHRY